MVDILNIQYIYIYIWIKVGIFFRCYLTESTNHTGNLRQKNVQICE